MTTPSFGQLVEQVKTTHNYTNDQAYAYLASAFFTLASDKDVVRVSETIGLSKKVS
jgi:formylmethanofuran dehydrogenase subunit D